MFAIPGTQYLANSMVLATCFLPEGLGTAFRIMSVHPVELHPKPPPSIFKCCGKVAKW